jgi:glycosyltransferase involved in cell wall biosynthesis
MKILIVVKHYLPRVGGVEKQVAGLSERLVSKGHTVTVLTEKYDESLPQRQKLNGVNVLRVRFPHIKYFGLVYIWCWFLIHKDFIDKFDVIHFHSSFIWYWPLRILLPKKRVYVTFHGWEGIYPIPFKNKLIRKIDALLATKNIAISGYLQKYYGFKADEISYTAVDLPKARFFKKDRKRLLYVGRLDKDTGLPIILKALRFLKNFKVDFCGDGELREECSKYGDVHGFTDPGPFYKKAYICLSPGITSILEAFTYKCLIVTTYNNPLKKDYLLTNPFSEWIVVENTSRKLAKSIKYYSDHPVFAKVLIDKCYEWVKTQNWDNEVKKYLDLFRN